MQFSKILEDFLKSSDFKPAIMAATKASWAGNGYWLELFPSGSWRWVWSCSVGNKYVPEGIMLPLPTLNESMSSEEDIEDYLDLCFANEAEELAEDLRQRLGEAE